MMIASVFSALNLKNKKVIIIIMLLNVVSSILHYVHNIAHFEDYPEPEWLSPHLVDYFWFVMTPIGLYGLVSELRDKTRRANVFLLSYAVMSLFVLLHYAVDTEVEITFIIHAFIWIEALCAMLLLIYLKQRNSMKA